MDKNTKILIGIGVAGLAYLVYVKNKANVDKMISSSKTNATGATNPTCVKMCKNAINNKDSGVTNFSKCYNTCVERMIAHPNSSGSSAGTGGTKKNYVDVKQNNFFKPQKGIFSK
jgi:hypothetical protein